MARYNRIDLNAVCRNLEGEADGAITPGMAIKLDSDGLYTVVGSAGYICPLRIAQENALQGKTVGDAYADGDRVFFIVPAPGDEVAVLLKDGESVVPGDLLNASTDGTFVKRTGDRSVQDEGVVLSAPVEVLETLDLSGGSNTTNELVKVLVF